MAFVSAPRRGISGTTPEVEILVAFVKGSKRGVTGLDARGG